MEGKEWMLVGHRGLVREEVVVSVIIQEVEIKALERSHG
jgi:hypothetical protein